MPIPLERASHDIPRFSRVINPSIFKKRVLDAVACLVIYPTLLASSVGGLFVAMKLYSFLFVERPAAASDLVAHLLLGVITALGWIGVITGIKLYNHFSREEGPPKWSRCAWAGLLCGIVASTSLVVWGAGSLIVRVGLFGFPVIGAFILGWFLISARND